MNEGKSALIYFVMANDTKMTKILLQHHADASIRDHQGKTARMYAAYQDMANALDDASATK